MGKTLVGELDDPKVTGLPTVVQERTTMGTQGSLIRAGSNDYHICPKVELLLHNLLKKLINAIDERKN